MADALTFKQFWVGIGLTIATTIATVGLGIWQTKSSIDANSSEQDRVHASALLKELTLAISEVQGQLRAHASMFFEVEGCLLKSQKNPPRCWNRTYTFDPAKTQKAWV